MPVDNRLGYTFTTRLDYNKIFSQTVIVFIRYYYPNTPFFYLPLAYIHPQYFVT